MSIRATRPLPRHILARNQGVIPKVSPRPVQGARANFYRGHKPQDQRLNFLKDLECHNNAFSWKELTAVLPGPAHLPFPKSFLGQENTLRRHALEELFDKVQHYPLNLHALRALGLHQALQILVESPKRYGEVSKLAAKVRAALDKRMSAAPVGDAAALYHLGTYAFPHSEGRDQDKNLREFFYLYKNDPRFNVWLGRVNLTTESDLGDVLRLYQRSVKSLIPSSPGRRIDLTDEALRAESATFQKYPALELLRLTSETIICDGGLKKKACLYEETVLQLRAGDVVSFGKKQFHLRRFLGAGNASHVWEVEEGGVLKVPFGAGSLLHIANPIRNREYVPRDPIDYPRHFIKRMLQLRTPYETSPHFRAVKIRDYGENGEFIWVDFVNIRMMGDQALALLQAGKTPPQFGPNPAPLIAQLDAAMVADAKLQLKNGNIFQMPWYPREWILLARQFALDDDGWICMDWE